MILVYGILYSKDLAQTHRSEVFASRISAGLVGEQLRRELAELEQRAARLVEERGRQLAERLELGRAQHRDLSGTLGRLQRPQHRHPLPQHERHVRDEDHGPVRVRPGGDQRGDGLLRGRALPVRLVGRRDDRALDLVFVEQEAGGVGLGLAFRLDTRVPQDLLLIIGECADAGDDHQLLATDALLEGEAQTMVHALRLGAEDDQGLAGRPLLVERDRVEQAERLGQHRESVQVDAVELGHLPTLDAVGPETLHPLLGADHARERTGRELTPEDPEEVVDPSVMAVLKPSPDEGLRSSALQTSPAIRPGN